MPQGNAPTANEELITQFGLEANAEELIFAHKAARSTALRQASLKKRNDDASNELDDDELAEAFGLPEGHTVASSAVRGGAVLIVAYDTNGRSYKPDPISHADVGGPAHAVAPKVSAEDIARREQLDAQTEAQRIREKAEAEAEAIIAKAREDAEKARAEILASAPTPAGDVTPGDAPESGAVEGEPLTDEQIDALTGDDLDEAVADADIDASKGGTLADGGMSADEKRAALKAKNASS